MAKKKKRKLKRGNSFNRHHLLWQGRYWNRGYVKMLRDYWYCIVSIPKDTLHSHIHHEINHIPVPDGFSAKEVLQELRRLESFRAISEYDSIEKRLNILIALFDIIEPATTVALRKQLHIVRAYKNKPPLV